MSKKFWGLVTGYLILSLLFTSCTDDPQKQAQKKGEEIWFEELLHNYGEIPQNSDGTWSFVFKNLGDKPIVVNRVRTTCGCTVPHWPKEPVEPGEEGKITIKYNTSNTGTFLKSATVYSTAANSPVKLQIKGKVVPEEK